LTEELNLKIKITKELIRSVKNSSARKIKNKELKRLAKKIGLDIELVEEKKNNR